MRLLETVDPVSSVRLAWTLSPESVASRYESGAPSLVSRLKAVRKAAERGWRIGLCLDPILMVHHREETYGEFMDLLECEIPWKMVEQVELGVFRMSSTHFKRMQKRPGTDLLQYPYEHDKNAVSYNLKERKELLDLVYGKLLKLISEEKIHLWI
jgi:spore photoproduct lyase